MVQAPVSENISPAGISFFIKLILSEKACDIRAREMILTDYKHIKMIHQTYKRVRFVKEKYKKMKVKVKKTNGEQIEREASQKKKKLHEHSYFTSTRVPACRFPDSPPATKLGSRSGSKLMYTLQ